MAQFQYVIRYWLPIVIYCLLIFIQSSFVLPEQIPKLPNIDKIFHFLAYAILGALFLRAFRALWPKNKMILLFFLSIMATSLYGISDELHQLYVPGRNASFLDITADTLGGIFGVIFSARCLYNYSFPR
jgi:VanZ family protein